MGAKQRIFEQFENGTLGNKTLGEICKLLDIPYRERNRLLSLLNELIDDGVLYVDEGGMYGTNEQLGLIKGIISGNERGFAFLVPEDKETYLEDFFISRNRLYGALHGEPLFMSKLLNSVFAKTHLFPHRRRFYSFNKLVANEMLH